MNIAHRTWALALIALGAPQAFAGPSDFPRYAVGEWCAYAAALQRRDARAIREGCLRQETTSLELLRSRWAGLPVGLRRECIPASQRSRYGSYYILRICIWGGLPEHRKHELVQR